MTHPFHEHRQSKVEHARVAHITKGYASGGAVHGDEAEDKALIRREVKSSSLKADGGTPKHRSDRPKRARGGRTKSKGKGGATVNVIVAGGGHPAATPGVAGPMPPPVAAAAPAMPPRPPMAAGAAPMAVPGGAPPPGMMGPRKHGGRTYARGGGVGPGWTESERLKTKVSHSPGKNDGKDIGRGKAITYATGGMVKRAAGGPIYSAKGPMAPKLSGGAGGGEARLEKEERARRKYKAAPAGSPTS